MDARYIDITTRSPEQTYELGRQIGACLKGGTVIALTGDLGSGKTALVQGLARGLGVPDEYYVTSPTYTLINEYPGRLPLYHADLYRLEAGADSEEIGLCDILEGEGVVAIEWSERLHPDALSDYLSIHLEITDDTSRRVRLTSYGLEADNLVREVGKITEENKWG